MTNASVVGKDGNLPALCPTRIEPCFAIAKGWQLRNTN